MEMLGGLLDRGWKAKRRLHSQVSTPEIDRVLLLAKQRGRVRREAGRRRARRLATDRAPPRPTATTCERCWPRKAGARARSRSRLRRDDRRAGRRERCRADAIRCRSATGSATGSARRYRSARRTSAARSRSGARLGRSLDRFRRVVAEPLHEVLGRGLEPRSRSARCTPADGPTTVNATWRRHVRGSGASMIHCGSLRTTSARMVAIAGPTDSL